jgi:hypothetical protein
MALIVFSGGATLSVPGTARRVAEQLQRAANEAGYVQLGTLVVNPYQVAYVTDDETMRPGMRV